MAELVHKMKRSICVASIILLQLPCLTSSGHLGVGWSWVLVWGHLGQNQENTKIKNVKRKRAKQECKWFSRTCTGKTN